MMKRKVGFTLIEILMVVAIIGLLISLSIPRFDLLMQKASQSTSKNNVGSIRTALSIYYTENNQNWPYAGHPETVSPSGSLSEVLVPKYLGKMPIPQVKDRVNSFNGLSFPYDPQAKYWMSFVPPKDIAIIHITDGNRGTPFVNKPYVYNPETGLIYICNGNYDTTSNRIFDW